MASWAALKAKSRGSAQGIQAIANGPKWAGQQGAFDEAVREITEQLLKPGSDGRVWISGWGKRFEAELGPMRAFLESQPDKFVVTPEEGRRFSVALTAGATKRTTWAKGGAARGGKGGSWAVAIKAGGGGGWGSGPIKAAAPARATGWQGGRAGGKGGGGTSWDPTVAAAIREIREQLQAQGGEGKVWVEQWGRRFQESLGTFRDFLESRPDKFTVIPGQGNRFTVALAAGGAGGAIAPAKRKASPWAQPQPAKKIKATPALPMAAKIESKEELFEEEAVEEDLEAEAVKEITKQLEKPGNTGNVWVRNWPRRYAPSLGPLRDFLDSQPDKFLVIPGEGRRFTVELVVT